ncbi:MAG TPA: diguanylate cyclase [Nevskiaceae bacterium]|nr:diguanylate cyclase [Nevskiaceae bacterium]
MTPPPAAAWVRWRRPLAALLLAATLVAVWQAHSLVVAHREARIDAEIRRIETAINERLAAYMQVLRGGRGMFEASTEVTRDDWRQYVAQLRLAEHYPGIRSMTFTQRVALDERPAFIARVRSEPFDARFADPERITRFDLRPPPPPITPVEPEEHAVVLYTEPLTADSERALGIDMMRDAGRRDSLRAAVASDHAALSPRLRLLSAVGTQVGFIGYQPAYRHGVHIGWVNATFHAEAFMQGLLGAAGSALDFEVYDGPVADASRLLYATTAPRADGEPQPLATADWVREPRRLEVPGRQWTLRFAQRDDPVPLTERLVPWLLLAAGLMATALFNASARHAARVRAALEETAGHNRRLREEMLERERAEARAHHLATHDPLTGLANRALFMDRLSSAIERSRRRQEGFVLAYIDIDGFKPVNDQHGHHIGDALLCGIAERLSARLRSEDTLARLGGDEFAIILERTLQPPERAVQVCSEIVEGLFEVFELPAPGGRVTVRVGASTGVALHPVHGSSRDELIVAADGAMYRAKRAGRGRCEMA